MNYADKIYCAKCHAEIEADDRFCGECGAIVDSPPPLTSSNDDVVLSDAGEFRSTNLRQWKWKLILFPIMLLISYLVLLEVIDPGVVQALAINSDAKLLASGGENGSVMVWRLPEKSLLLEIDAAYPIRHLMFNKKGDRLAVAYSESMEVYSLSGNKIEKIMSGNDNYIKTLCFDEQSVYTLNAEGKLKVWNAEKNWQGVLTNDIQEDATDGGYGNIKRASFSQNCRKLIVSYYSHEKSTLYNVDQLTRLGQQILHASGRLESMASSPAAEPEAFAFFNEGASVAELNDSELLIYDFVERHLIKKIELSHMPGDAPLVIDPDRKNIITGWGNGSIGFDDMNSGKMIGKLYHGSFLYRMVAIR